MIGDSPNELELLATRSIDGDTAAFDELVRATHRLAYQLAFRMLGREQDVDDILQDAYLRVWQSLPGLRDRTAVLSWVCRIVRNVTVDRIRQYKRHSLRIDQSAELDKLLEATASDGPDPETAATSAQQRRTIAAAVAELKDKHRVVLLLREVDDMSYEQIGVALGIPIGTVESRLFRARKDLAGKLRRARKRSSSEEAA